MKFFHKLTVGLAALFVFIAVTPAQADADVGSVIDGQLVLGKRVFALPPGRWIVVNSAESTVGLIESGARGASTKSQYLVQVDAENRFIAAVNIRTTLASTHVSYWNDTTCDRKDTLFWDKLDGNFKFPACLLVNYSTNFWKGVPDNEYDKKIWSWYQEKKLTMPSTAVSTAYIKFFAGDFVRATYWFNPELAGIPVDGASVRSQSAWNSELLKSNPERQRYIESVKSWSASLIAANRASLYDGKPNIASLPALPGLAM